mmetsp:Transcript_39560/g.77881  ORF Transcript_39560/g.77881 Transcript_39560/m.77881 type:complete len:175 (+) Transcript_39560:316-840(+)
MSISIATCTKSRCRPERKSKGRSVEETRKWNDDGGERKKQKRLLSHLKSLLRDSRKESPRTERDTHRDTEGGRESTSLSNKREHMKFGQALELEIRGMHVKTNELAMKHREHTKFNAQALNAQAIGIQNAQALTLEQTEHARFPPPLHCFSFLSEVSYRDESGGSKTKTCEGGK